MYQQYRKIKDNVCELIEISGNFNDVNEEIIKREKENGLKLDEILAKFIFKDWKIGDILLIQDCSVVNPIFDNETIREMTTYEMYKNNLYELKNNEVIYKDDILVLEQGQYVDEKGVLQTVPKPEGTRVEWNWQTHEWEEKATNLEIVQAQYKDYEGMDTPSTLEEMKQQDPALATEYLNMMIELRGLIYTLSANNKHSGFVRIVIPKPSKTLQAFKDKFTLIK